MAQLEAFPWVYFNLFLFYLGNLLFRSSQQAIATYFADIVGIQFLKSLIMHFPFVLYIRYASFSNNGQVVFILLFLKFNWRETRRASSTGNLCNIICLNIYEENSKQWERKWREIDKKWAEEGRKTAKIVKNCAKQYFWYTLMNKCESVCRTILKQANSDECCS